MRIGLPNRNRGAAVRVIVRPIPPLAMASATRMNGEAESYTTWTRFCVRGRLSGVEAARILPDEAPSVGTIIGAAGRGTPAT